MGTKVNAREKLSTYSEKRKLFPCAYGKYQNAKKNAIFLLFIYFILNSITIQTHKWIKSYWFGWCLADILASSCTQHFIVRVFVFVVVVHSFYVLVFFCVLFSTEYVRLSNHQYMYILFISQFLFGCAHRNLLWFFFFLKYARKFPTKFKLKTKFYS